jgi:glycosyltransferase domain-containing protein
MDKNFTILLVLKDRPSYTMRFMNYMNHLYQESNPSNYPFKIVIADGGSDLNIQKTLENKSNFPNLEYQYLRYKYDETLDDFHEKMASAVDHITTPVASVLDNDDFILLEGVYNSLNFLKNNHDYSSSRGAVTIMNILAGRLRLGSNIYSIFKDPIVSSSAAGRMIEQTKAFHGNWHNLTRTRHLKASWKMINVAKPQNMRFTEQMTGYLNIIWGHGHRDVYPWLLRQDGERIKTKEGTLADHFPPQEVWIKSDFWQEEFNKMTEVVGVAISAYDNIPVEEAMDKFSKTYPHKVPDHFQLLQDRIKGCQKLGYNEQRIERMFDILRKHEVEVIDPLEDIDFQYPTAEQEIDILSSFLL